MTRLPDSPWRQSAGLRRIVDTLGAEQLRVVGGAVRDTLLRLPVTDIDLATPLHPEAVMERLTTADIKVIPTGIAHGTITAIASGDRYEITTLRRDVATDGRRATVAFAEDWHDDAARRDFTINALYAHAETGVVEDWFGGIADLEARRIRFIGDAATRIAEDHLRILRFYRFAARFGGGELDPASHAAAVAARHSLKSLSRERIADELTKILALPDPRAIVRQMEEDGIFAVLLPEMAADYGAALDLLLANEQAAEESPAALRRLAALLPPAPEVAEQVASRLRLSKRQRAHLVALAGRGECPLPPARQLAHRVGIEAARDIYVLSADDAAARMAAANLAGWKLPELPIKGGDIVARGVAAGPEVARILKAVEARWVAEDFPDAARVDALLAAMLDQKIG